MSKHDCWHVTTIRTYTCDGCGIGATVTEEHPVNDSHAYITSGTNGADLDLPVGWVETYCPSHEYHSRECALDAAAKELFDSPRSEPTGTEGDKA